MCGSGPEITHPWEIFKVEIQEWAEACDGSGRVWMLPLAKETLDTGLHLDCHCAGRVEWGSTGQRDRAEQGLGGLSPGVLDEDGPADGGWGVGTQHPELPSHSARMLMGYLLALYTGGAQEVLVASLAKSQRVCPRVDAASRATTKYLLITC